jgi:hypothetical protein
MAPFLVACALGGWNSSTGLVDSAHDDDGIALFFLGLLATLCAAGFLVACVQVRTSRGAPGAVLAVAATYLVPVLADRAGPWSAALEGAALLGLAWLTQTDVRRQRRLPTEPLLWPWRAVAAVAAAAAVLDVVVALLGGRPGSYHLSTLAVLVAGVTSTGLLALSAALADGARPRVGSRGGSAAAAAPYAPEQGSTD